MNVPDVALIIDPSLKRGVVLVFMEENTHQIAKNKVAYLIKLEEHKVIERRSDPNDKRKSVIHLTPLGINRREIAKKVVIDFNENVKSHFEKEEMDTFFAILKKINKIIDSTK